MKRPADSTYRPVPDRFEVPLITIAPDLFSGVGNTVPANVPNAGQPQLHSGHSPRRQELGESNTFLVNPALTLPMFPIAPYGSASLVNRPTFPLLGRPGPAYAEIQKLDRQRELAERANVTSQMNPGPNRFIGAGHVDRLPARPENVQNSKDGNKPRSVSRPDRTDLNLGSVESRHTALCKAIELGDIGKVNSLMQDAHFRGALCKKGRLDIMNPLTDAIARGHDDIVKALLADPELGKQLAKHSVKHKQDLRILLAIKLGKLDIVNALLGVDRELLFRQSARCGYVIHAAVEAGNAEIVRALLAQGNVRTQTGRFDQNQRNPMMLAVKLGHKEIVELFLQQDNAAEQLEQVDLGARNALAYSRKFKKNEIEQLILAHQNKVRQEAQSAREILPENALSSMNSDYAQSVAEFYNSLPVNSPINKPNM